MVITITKENWLNRQPIQFAFFILFYKIICLAINLSLLKIQFSQASQFDIRNSVICVIIYILAKSKTSRLSD